MILGYLPDTVSQMLGRVTHVILAILLLQSAAIGLVGADHATAEEALNQKHSAERLLNELDELAGSDGVTIDPRVIQNIRAQVQDGQIHYDRAEYHEAHEKWQTAAEQARAALKQGYTNRTRFLLNASSHQLAERKEAGYVAPEQSDLVARHDELRRAVEEVDSLAEARQIHADAKELHGDVTELPDPNAIEFAQVVDWFWFLSPVVGVLFVLFGFLIGRTRYKTQPVIESEPGKGDEESTTTSTPDPTDYRGDDD